MRAADAAGCPLCLKHRGAGPLAGSPWVWADDLVVVTGLRPDDDGRGYLGHVCVETRRHAAYLDDLSPEEAAAVGVVVSAVARALREELRPAMVYSMVTGRGVAHFHQHVVVEHEGTPPGTPVMDVDDWDGAPRGDAVELAALCARLRARLSGPLGPGHDLPLATPR